MSRLLLAVALALVAAGAAAVISRRTRRSPGQSPSWTVPAQLDRRDFARPEAPWLVLLFSSATCQVCSSVWERAQVVEGRDVAVQNLEAKADRALHERYRIDAVPLLLLADAEGVVRRHFLGPVTAGDLWGALADLR
jgi:hypothetical protein